jgi:uncharacterized secreted repeat protein (TIGR03808 family)
MSRAAQCRISRRAFARGALALTSPMLAPAAAATSLFSGALDATEVGLRPGAVEDQGAALATALVQAAAMGQPLFLPPGRYAVANVALPAHAHLIGIPGESRLVFAGGDFMLRSEHARRLRLEGVALDGGALPLSSALLDVDGVDDIAVDDSDFVASGAAGIRLRAAAGRVTSSRFDLIGTIGVYLRQSNGLEVSGNSVTNCGDTGILVARDGESEDGTIVRGNRVSRIRAESGGTGQNGNGINLDKANGVVIADNRVDDCAFSAIRCFSSDDIAVTGNVATNSGEMALYVEFAFEGAIVANNLIDGANGGISFANFMEHGGRLGTCSGNVVRRIRGGPAYPDGNLQNGAGISAEADVAITGNTIEDAIWGLQLGWGPYLRDVTASGNVIRRTQIGIAVSVAEGAGPALIANNLIDEAKRGAILGMRWEEVATEELVDGTVAVPGVSIDGNRKA